MSDDFIPLNETMLILEKSDRVMSSKDAASNANKFVTRPQGILIQDSYNNPFFPIRPTPRLDTSKIDILEVHRRYREKHSKQKSIFLPWHFCVEMVQDRFYVFNTRPLDMKFPINSLQASQRDEVKNWDDVTKLFMKEAIYDIDDAIHVCIIGDTNLDVYTRKIYEMIGRTCIIPTLRQYRLPGGLYQRVFGLNLGSRFNMDYVAKFIRK